MQTTMDPIMCDRCHEKEATHAFAWDASSGQEIMTAGWCEECAKKVEAEDAEGINEGRRYNG